MEVDCVAQSGTFKVPDKWPKGKGKGQGKGTANSKDLPLSSKSKGYDWSDQPYRQQQWHQKGYGGRGQHQKGEAGKGKSGKGQQQQSWPLTSGKGLRFEGYCNKCGKYGHKAVDCRSVAQLESQSSDEWQSCRSSASVLPQHQQQQQQQQQQQAQLQSVPSTMRALLPSEDLLVALDRAVDCYVPQS
jgi:hypothetical protein